MVKRLVSGKLRLADVDRAGVGTHGDGGGLYLVVSSSSARSWMFRYTLFGHRREMGLGSASSIGLADARDQATDARRLVAMGQDPIAHREAKRLAAKAEQVRGIMFGEYARKFITAKAPGWRNAKHAAQWTMTILGELADGQPAEQDYCQAIRSLSLAEIDTAAVLKVLMPIWRTKPETASRIRSRLENIFDGAKAEGVFVGENPARWRGGLKHILPSARSKRTRVRHQPALPYADVPAFISALRTSETSIAARALEFLILTAMRPGNIVKARWAHINLEAKTWVVPAAEMKADAAHTVYLSSAAVALLEQIKQARVGRCQYVFPSVMGRGAGAQHHDRPMSDAALSAVIDRMTAKGGKWIDPVSGRQATPHGFRSSFRDWGSETDAAPEFVLEATLAHVVSDDVIAAYRRSKFNEKRRQVLETWGRYATGAGAKVLPMVRPL
jgi:integrase